MAFPFPKNPTDGQVVTSTASDGTALVATYRQLKNEWEVKRVDPSPPTITLASGVAYTVTPGSDGQVLTYDQNLNQWVGKAPAAASGGIGGTFVKANLAAPDTPNPPDPTLPTQFLRAGMLQTTPENLRHELKYWDGSAWSLLFGEEQIKQWIAAGSLFRGVIQQATLGTLPDVAVANRGYYWSWTGVPGYVVKKTDAKIGAALEGEILQVGDWIQSDGSKWVHVPGDLLSKQRWDSLGSFAPWSDTSWEQGSVVSYQKSFFRASALISTGDLAPGVTPGAPGEVQKWVDITPLPHMSTGDLSNVNANTINGGGTHGAVFQWDDNVGEWVSSDTLEVSEVKTGTVKFGDLYGQISGVESIDLDATDPTDQDTFVPSVYAVKEFVKGQPKPFLEELEDCTELASAEDGQLPVWSATSNKWVPGSGSIATWTDKAYKKGELVLFNNELFQAGATLPVGSALPGSNNLFTTGIATVSAVPNGNNVLFRVHDTSGKTSAISYGVYSGDLSADKVASALSDAANRDTGMSALAKFYAIGDKVYVFGKKDSVSVTPQVPYIAASTLPASALVSWVKIGGSSSAGEFINDLVDVNISTPAGDQVLQYKTATSSWENVTPDYLNPTNGYTKTEVDNKIGSVVIGLEHYEAVLSRVDTPPASPAANDLYIVGATPTGLWTGQANNLARWDGAAWQFEVPNANEAHLVEDVAETWHWNGTAWVKVATASTGAASGAGDLLMVGDLKQSLLTEQQFKALLPVAEQAKWVLADGRDVSGTKYATTTGRHWVPDLRGAYLRMAGTNNSNAAWIGGSLNGYLEDSTARPKIAFTTDAQGEHRHAPADGWKWHGLSNGSGAANLEWSGGQTPNADQWTKLAGSHTHTIVQGGDTETRPKSYSVNYFIKVN